MIRDDSSVTLLELIVVVIIIGVLAILALPQLRVARVNALDREAQANLRLIQAAEKIYRMEATFYAVCADRGAINTTLLLDIPDTPNWTYAVSVSGGLFTGRAGSVVGANDPSRAWCVQRDSATPYGCP